MSMTWTQADSLAYDNCRIIVGLDRVLRGVESAVSAGIESQVTINGREESGVIAAGWHRTQTFRQQQQVNVAAQSLSASERDYRNAQRIGASVRNQGVIGTEIGFALIDGVKMRRKRAVAERNAAPGWQPYASGQLVLSGEGIDITEVDGGPMDMQFDWVSVGAASVPQFGTVTCNFQIDSGEYVPLMIQSDRAELIASVSWMLRRERPIDGTATVFHAGFAERVSWFKYDSSVVVDAMAVITAVPEPVHRLPEPVAPNHRQSFGSL
jgi:hypothetical protein